MLIQHIFDQNLDQNCDQYLFKSVSTSGFLPQKTKMSKVQNNEVLPDKLCGA